ncbi:UNVERIFIED_CONTAM: hypothetical protein K2H54_025587 [Gekko kuhli]
MSSGPLGAEALLPGFRKWILVTGGTRFITFRYMAMEEFQVALHQGKLSDAISMVQAKPLQYFSNTPLNVAVVGEPGSGKSSFVNSMLGKRPGEPGAAETGIQTTTTKAKDYPLPMLPQVTLWDLPGREESYGSRVDQVDLNRFDFFIIVGYQHFRTVHAELAHEIQAMGKRFYFVRAKTDLDLEASRRRQPSGYDYKKVLQRIREDCVTCLQNESVINPQVFLVSNWDPQSLDFRLLEKKKAVMKWKMWLKALYSGFLDLLPVPGFSFVAAVFFLVRFAYPCYRVFGLDDMSLTALARDVGKPVAALRAVMTSKVLPPLSSPVLENKKAMMKWKMWLKALYSGFLGLLPVPGFSFVAALFFFLRFCSEHYQVFGLDHILLIALARDVGELVAALQAVMMSKVLASLSAPLLENKKAAMKGNIWIDAS